MKIKVISWLSSWLLAVGSGFVTAGLLGVVTSAEPMLIAFGAVVGGLLQVLSLVIELSVAATGKGEGA